MTVVLAKRSDKPHARPRGRLHPTDNGDGADAGRSSMAPRQVPVPLRAARQGTQHSGTKLLSQPRHLIESRFMLRCQPLSLYKKCPHDGVASAAGDAAAVDAASELNPEAKEPKP